MARMGAAITYYVGDDPMGYGGADEVSVEQARAYAEAIAVEMRRALPAFDVRVGHPATYAPLAPEQYPAHAFVQRNWRRIRAEVNAAHGWDEQYDGTPRNEERRCL